MRPRGPAIAALALVAAVALEPLAARATDKVDPGPALSVVAARPVRAGTVLGPGDLTLAAPASAGALASVEEGIGLEAQVTLYPGRPVRPTDLAPPALVERNTLIRLTYSTGGLRIQAEGRALDRGEMGARVRVMNMDSRTVVTGVVAGPHHVEVGR